MTRTLLHRTCLLTWQLHLPHACLCQKGRLTKVAPCHGVTSRSWALAGELHSITSKLDGKGQVPVAEAKMPQLVLLF